MTATKLLTRRIEKIWGRANLWPGFADPAPGAPPVGEIWFETPSGGSPDLLVKYLFTSERLSVQVHPDDARARAAGYPRGKDEAWVILAADPGATIALGTLEPLDKAMLKSAAEDGSIEHLLDWKPVKAGDVFYSGAGTVHAIGAGITLVEVQQNVDLTYRLYDYGRPRELHLDDAVAVADAVPFVAQAAPGDVGDGRAILAEGPKFVLERWHGRGRDVDLSGDRSGWLIPLAGHGMADDVEWTAGDCVLIDGHTAITASDDSDILFAYPGDARL